MIHRHFIDRFELCIEIWHDHNADLDETIVSTKVLYYEFQNYKGKNKYVGLKKVRVPRGDVPVHIMVTFDRTQEVIYWDYVEHIEAK